MATNNGASEHDTTTIEEERPQAPGPTKISPELQHKVDGVRQVCRNIMIPGCSVEASVYADSTYDSPSDKVWYRGGVTATITVRDKEGISVGRLQLLLQPGSSVSWSPSTHRAEI